MKKIILFTLFLFVFLAIAVFYFIKDNPFSLSPSPTPQALGVESQFAGLKKISFQEKEYAFSFFAIDEIDRFFLFPNFADKLTAKELKEKNNCNFLVSGGFYTTDSSPTGLFVSEGRLIKKYLPNSLFNAVLSINDFATPRITRSIPQDRSRIALQTGPLLIENGMVQELAIRNDEEKRRIAAAVTGENMLLFVVIFDSTSYYKGPRLNDLPEIVKLISDDNDLNLADVVNLDGGTASAFLSEEISLTELSSIGSFFCLK